MLIVLTAPLQQPPMTHRDDYAKLQFLQAGYGFESDYA